MYACMQVFVIQRIRWIEAIKTRVPEKAFCIQPPAEYPIIFIRRRVEHIADGTQLSYEFMLNTGCE